jgi:hypothetical protein
LTTYGIIVLGCNIQNLKRAAQVLEHLNGTDQLTGIGGERAKPILPESGAIRNTRGIAPFLFAEPRAER